MLPFQDPKLNPLVLLLIFRNWSHLLSFWQQDRMFSQMSQERDLMNWVGWQGELAPNDKKVSLYSAKSFAYTIACNQHKHHIG